MTSNQILALGAVAGSTILLGLPLGRMGSPSLRVKAGLSALATGILLFLLYDVIHNGIDADFFIVMCRTEDGEGGSDASGRMTQIIVPRDTPGVNIVRNFGSPYPEGFRKAQRLMSLVPATVAAWQRIRTGRERELERLRGARAGRRQRGARCVFGPGTRML